MSYYIYSNNNNLYILCTCLEIINNVVDFICFSGTELMSWNNQVVVIVVVVNITFICPYIQCIVMCIRKNEKPSKWQFDDYIVYDFD